MIPLAQHARPRPDAPSTRCAICTMMLHDLGAEIIKIEDPQQGDYARWMPPLIDGMGAFIPQQQPRQKERHPRLESGGPGKPFCIIW